MVSGFPFDTIKVRLQASPSRYTGAWDCFLRICRQEGVCALRHACAKHHHQPQPRTLFRGLSPPLVGGAVETGINYAVYAASLRVLSVRHQAPGAPLVRKAGFRQQGNASQPALVHVGAAAAAAGVALSVVLSPVELVKCRHAMPPASS